MTAWQIDDFWFPERTDWGWFFNKVEDWNSGSGNKVGVTERARSHGANSRKRAFRSSLAFSLHVGFVGTDREDLNEALLHLAALGAEGPVTVTEHAEHGTFSRVATIENRPTPDTRGRTRMDGIVIDMLAEDSLKFGPAEYDSTGLPTPGTGLVYPITYPLDWGQPGTGGRLTLTNRGTATVAPRFYVNGGLGTTTITQQGTGKRLTLSRQIPEASIVLFDGRTRRVTLDGETDLSIEFLTQREWPVIGPGETSTFLFTGTATGGTPMCTGELIPRWW